MRSELRPGQTLSPRLQHAVRLLQMSSLDFAALLRQQLDRNPFLDSDDDFGEPAADEGELDDRALWQSGTPTTPRYADGGELSAMEMLPAEVTLSAHLQGQLNLMTLSARDLLQARSIVESLDDDGYLRTPLADLAALPEMPADTSVDEMRIALRRVQALDPAGVGARSVAECLELQLPAITCPQMRELARAIVSRNLASLAARDMRTLCERFNLTPAMAEQVCDRLRHLDPRPGWRFGSSRVDHVVPDVVVRKHHGQWTVQLNPAVVPRLRLNREYAELFQRHRAPQHTDLAEHLQEARWTLRNVKQRFSTILDVARAITRRQRLFLEHGAMAMKPLGLREIADEVGVHESTVSRVTNNKYMATPIGVFELKHFFSRTMSSASGRACSGTAIRGLVRELIEHEAPQAPLSDAEITRLLAQQGLLLARRTVTKYRQLMHIDAVDRRRRYN